jgi:glyceraldehyde 3-phosphate dehydrogenase
MRIAINGFGRIGRVLYRLLSMREDIEVVAINDLGEPDVLTHLLKYDSIHRTYQGTIKLEDDILHCGTQTSRFYQLTDPLELPWKALNIDLVIESTGKFTTRKLASLHIEAGAKQVLLSAPAKSKDVKMLVLGVNDSIIDGTEDILSNASCTTNCAAPMVKIINEICDIDQAYITTVHSYTSDQRLHDAPHKDFRRARAGASSIVPTTTGAAKAVSQLFPHLQLGGCGIRVPVPDGSLTDITFVVKNPCSEEEINQAFKKAAESGSLKGILSYIEDPIVSTDIIGSPYSCTFDSKLTSVLGNMVKIVGWYDNEMGYSNRMVELILKLKKLRS